MFAPRSAALAIAIVAGLAGVVHATGNIFDLGRPAGAIPQYVALSGFQRAAPLLRASGLPALFVEGGTRTPYYDAESWALVKALAQFGTWSNGEQDASQPFGIFNVLGLPGVDVSHATYRSRYLRLLNAVSNAVSHPGERSVIPFTQEEKLLWKRYVLTRNYLDHGPLLIWIGRYVRAGSGIPPGDLEDNAGTPLSFDAVQTALQQGYKPHFVSYVYEIDAETNVITALICHSDGGKPAAVCRRPAVRQILKHVK